MCGHRGLLTSRMRSMWSGQGPASPLIILLLSWSFSPKGMNLQLLYPEGGPSTSCLRRKKAEAGVLAKSCSCKLECVLTGQSEFSFCCWVKGSASAEVLG